LKRFEVQLFIAHPDMDPAIISQTLGLEAKFAWRAGDKRLTPAGREIGGAYRDTRWRHCRRHETAGQGFRDEVADLLTLIEPHASFLRTLTRTGGTACLIVALLGDGHFGEELSPQLLARLVAVDLSFGLEVYGVPQT
jgi:hypothetical protein